MAGGETLAAEHHAGNAPALIEAAEHVGLRHAHLVEEFLGEFGVAFEGLDRPHGNAGRMHIDEQHGDAGMARFRLGIGAHQREHPIGVMAVGGPHLMAVDDEVIAVEHGACGQAGEIGAGAGLGIALAPRRLARQDTGQEARFLLVGAGRDDDRADEIEPVRVGRRRTGAHDLLEQDDLLRQARAHAAIFFRPMRRDPAALEQLPMPGLQLGRLDPFATMQQRVRQISRDPVAHLGAKGAIARRIIGKKAGDIPRHQSLNDFAIAATAFLSNLLHSSTISLL